MAWSVWWITSGARSTGGWRRCVASAWTPPPPVEETVVDAKEAPEIVRIQRRDPEAVTTDLVVRVAALEVRVAALEKLVDRVAELSGWLTLVAGQMAELEKRLDGDGQ